MKLVVWEYKFINEKKQEILMKLIFNFNLFLFLNMIYHCGGCSFNNSAQYLSFIDENGKVFLFINSERSKFQNIKIF